MSRRNGKVDNRNAVRLRDSLCKSLKKHGFYDKYFLCGIPFNTSKSPKIPDALTIGGITISNIYDTTGVMNYNNLQPDSKHRRLIDIVASFELIIGARNVFREMCRMKDQNDERYDQHKIDNFNWAGEFAIKHIKEQMADVKPLEPSEIKALRYAAFVGGPLAVLFNVALFWQFPYVYLMFFGVQVVMAIMSFFKDYDE